MHRSGRLAVAAACLAGALLAQPGVAAAHDPIIVDDSQTTPEAGPALPDGTISFALYGVVDGPGASRGFRVRFGDGDRLVISLLVPDLPPEQTMQPDDLPLLRVDAPDGTTRELAPDLRVPFDEPFSGTRYIRLLDLDEPAVAGGYAITVIGRLPARFTVSVGTSEQFGTPVDGVVDRDAGVAGVQAWYDTPPPDPVAVPTTGAVASTAPSTEPVTAPVTAPVTSPVTSPSTTAVTVSTLAEREREAAPGSADADADTDGAPAPNGVVRSLVATVVAVIVAGSAMVLVRRRRR